MIVTFSDYGLAGPYVGQMSAVLQREAPGVPIVDLMHDAPRFDPRASSYLLAALSRYFASGTVFLAVVDPGVGSDDREAIVLRTHEQWFVGPGNGLLAVVARQATNAKVWRITWRPSTLSRTFHGRDLFAPVAAMLANGETVPGDECSDLAPLGGHDFPEELSEIIYLDPFGNAVTGISADTVDPRAKIAVRGHELVRAETFADVRVGEPMWYENSIGLVELAVNKGSVAVELELSIGQSLEILHP